MKHHKNAQTWSLDLLLGLSVFILIFISVFGFITYLSKDSGLINIKEESELILSSLESENSEVGFIENNQINKGKLDTLSNPAGYEFLREKIGTKYDFCIYMEDENGNILNFNGDIADENGDLLGIGNQELPDEKNLKINGVPCGKKGQI